MSESTKSVSGSTSLPGLVFVLFLGLKLTHHIDWSWWWVAAPLWGTAAFVTISLILLAVVGE